MESECCGADVYIIVEDLDYICSECMEHCDVIHLDEEEE